MKRSLTYIVNIFIVLVSGFLLYLSYNNFVNNPKSTFSMNKQIKEIDLKIDKIDSNINDNKEILSNKNIQIENLKTELNNFNVIANKDKIDELKTNINYLDIKNVNSNLYLNNVGNLTQTISPLNSLFISNNLNDEQIVSNLNFLPIYLEYTFNNNLNLKISKHNTNILKYIGVLNYLDEGSNYLVKAKLLKDYTDLNNINNEAYEILVGESKYLNLFNDLRIINFNNKGSNFTQDLEGKIRELKNNKAIEEPDLKDVDLLGVFSYDILNTSASHLLFLKTSDLQNERILEDDNGIKLMSNVKDNKEYKVNYYDSKGNSFYIDNQVSR
ncbi:hemagglutination protein [Peptoniphilus lacrimalis]|uniref:coiled-coil domain-containing protein n=1 Tax=Peptoniphilus lacrimalis TaxID=33031 RepID=UPI0023F989E7|nr:hemagglutination protein [Peptoniphilus lacrimalis]MDK7721979.1 hemagglutination protein [Peptoniphilus lacrimalis]MDK7731775.1 hemagglutination protein [Peptoniphilus lacrimalis]